MFPAVELNERNFFIIVVIGLSIASLWLPIETIRVRISSDARNKAIVNRQKSDFECGTGLAAIAYIASAISAILYIIAMMVLNTICIGGLVATVIQIFLDAKSHNILMRVNANDDEFAVISKHWWLASVEPMLRACICVDVVITILLFM